MVSASMIRKGMEASSVKAIVVIFPIRWTMIGMIMRPTTMTSSPAEKIYPIWSVVAESRLWKYTLKNGTIIPAPIPTRPLMTMSFWIFRDRAIEPSTLNRFKGSIRFLFISFMYSMGMAERTMIASEMNSVYRYAAGPAVSMPTWARRPGMEPPTRHPMMYATWENAELMENRYIRSSGLEFSMRNGEPAMVYSDVPTP